MNNKLIAFRLLFLLATAIVCSQGCVAGSVSNKQQSQNAYNQPTDNGGDALAGLACIAIFLSGAVAAGCGVVYMNTQDPEKQNKSKEVAGIALGIAALAFIIA